MISLVALIFIVCGGFLFSIFYLISLQPASLALRIGDKAYRWCGLLRSLAMGFEMVVIVGYILFVLGDTYNFPILYHDVIIIRVIGVLFTLITVGFMFYGVKVAGKEASIPSQGTKLYQGIYNYMRHPQTLGEMLSWFGIAMILNSMTLLVFSVIWVPLFIGYTVIEDNDLAVRFGREYIEYTKKVGIFGRKKQH